MAISSAECAGRVGVGVALRRQTGPNSFEDLVIQRDASAVAKSTLDNANRRTRRPTALLDMARARRHVQNGLTRRGKKGVPAPRFPRGPFLSFRNCACFRALATDLGLEWISHGACLDDFFFLQLG